MTTRHRIKAGDGISSIAAASGHKPDTLWNHADNAALKAQRKRGDILAPGDTLIVPARSARWIEIQTGQRHRFKRFGVPGRFRMQLLFQGQVLADTPYLLELGERVVSGTTDDKGYLEAFLPLDLREGKLTVETVEIAFETVLRFGGLDPIHENSGLQHRLRNLGLYDEEAEGDDSQKLSAALRLFQEMQEIAVTGEADESTLEQLRQVHEGPDPFIAQQLPLAEGTVQ